MCRYNVDWQGGSVDRSIILFYLTYFLVNISNLASFTFDFLLVIVQEEKGGHGQL